MKPKTASGSHNDKKLITLGFVSIAILFIIYARFENPGITPDAIDSIERLGIAFYVLFTISFGVIGIGLRRYQKRIAATGNQNVLSMICNSTISSKFLFYDVRNSGLPTRSNFLISLWSRNPICTYYAMLWSSRICTKIYCIYD